MKITVLGCGGSHGVPMIGNRWGDCDPGDPRNRRRRPSVFVEWGDARILIDTSPDLRAQLLDSDIGRVDAVLFTHAHADHTNGIDDLRAIHRATRAQIDVFAEPDVLRAIEGRFPYLFDRGGASAHAFYPPVLRPREVCGRFAVDGHAVAPFAQQHGFGTRSTGYRMGPFAYSTDVVELDEAAFETLAGIELWIVDCLRVGPEHPTHAHLDRTLAWIDRVRPRRAVLTHMNHQTDYAHLAGLLPDGVEPAYDGLVLEIDE